MSGRLTILPKKTYCPWNQANVERVLRDERLERERVETEERAGRERTRGGRAEAPAGEAEGHINLFPEAKEAEVKLAQGQGQRPADNSGVLPVPLGGTPAATPFYLRPQTNASDGGKYDKESGLRALGRGGAAAAQADEITGKIMRDQYEKREDGRKDRMDPMSRFAGSTASQCRTSAKQRMGESNQADCNDGRRRSRDDNEHDKPKEEKRGKKRRKRSRRSHDISDGSSSDSDDCTSSSLSEDDSSTRPKSRSRDTSHSHDKRRHRRKKSRRRRESKRHRRHRHRSPPADRNSRIESNGKSQTKAEELNELRRRRQAREARETERERRLLEPSSGASSHLGWSMHHDRGGHFHDQFNPALSRN